MSDNRNFDYWYAVENTTVLLSPQRNLETFGNTFVRYNLITELMDSVGKVRVRIGNIKAYRPQIITPDSFSDNMLEGFDDESLDYLDWLQENNPDLFLLKYGFSIKNQEISEHVVSDSIRNVVERAIDEVSETEDVNSAVLVGVDKPWEVCLLKLMLEIVQDSATGNFNEIKRHRDLLRGKQSPRELRGQIEEEFELATRNPGRIDHLGRFLENHGLFEEYQDRFFSVVQDWKR